MRFLVGFLVALSCFGVALCLIAYSPLTALMWLVATWAGAATGIVVVAIGLRLTNRY